jgi:hypothetical protein
MCAVPGGARAEGDRNCPPARASEPFLAGAVGELYRSARGAAAAGALGVAREGVAGLGRTLEAHFALEDEVYFPAVALLRPDLAPLLRRLGGEHDQMLRWIADLAGRLARAEPRACVASLDALIAAFQRHEALEESLLGSLTAPGDG